MPKDKKIDIEQIIEQQEGMIRLLDELKKQSPNNYLSAAVLTQITAKNYLLAYKLGFELKKLRSDEDRRRYMQDYMRRYKIK